MIKLMIIEDDPMVREINVKFVNKVGGFNIISYTGSIEEAKREIEKNLPDVILLDIFLPKGNGLELLKWIRKKELNCDAILITADKSSDSVQEAFRYGAVDYLVKPFTYSRFEEALGQYKKRRESIVRSEQVQQDIIDNVIVKTSKGYIVKDETALVKGLSIRTYEQIFEAIKIKNDAFTADKLADELGMARVTVRRYLDYMVKEDKLKLEIEYGKIGRPTHLYKRNM